MVERIGENDVGGFQKGREQPDVGGVAGAEVERCFGSRELRNSTLEILPFERVSGEKARTS